eukprot:3672559-Pyramimonas_sp.AAC.1
MPTCAGKAPWMSPVLCVFGTFGRRWPASGSRRILLQSCGPPRFPLRLPRPPVTPHPTLYVVERVCIAQFRFSPAP